MSRRVPSLCRAAACAPIAVVLSAGGASADPAVATLQFDGHGAGHGVGLAQDSAEALAAAGATREQVLQRFYPHTGRARRAGAVRVSVWAAAPGAQDVLITLPTGGTALVDGHAAALPAGSRVRLWHDAAGYRLSLLGPGRAPAGSPAGSVPRRRRSQQRPDGGPHHPPDVRPAVRPDGEAPTTDPTAVPTTAPSTAPSSEPTPALTTSPTGEPGVPGETSTVTSRPTPARSTPSAARTVSGSPIVVRPAGSGALTVTTTGRSYRGTLSLVQADVLRLVNAVDVETYLQGLGEVPASWHPAALEAQAVAARTYALRAATAARTRAFDLCDDEHCQVYLGLGTQDPRTTAAARATRGEVVTYAGQLATTYYSANAGGITADPVEGLGAAAPLPYLPARVTAPGPTRPWSYRVTTADVATALHYPGTVTALTVARRGPSGRAETLEVAGTAGTRTVPALAAAGSLGLPSTLFTVGGSSLSATAALRGGLSGAALQLSPDLASLDPVVAPLTVTPGEIPRDAPASVTLTNAADHGTDRSAAMTIGLVLGGCLTLMVVTSRRRLLAVAPAAIVAETDRPQVIRSLAVSAPAPHVTPAGAGRRRGRSSPTLWLTVGAVTVGSAGALAAVRLTREND